MFCLQYAIKLCSFTNDNLASASEVLYNLTKTSFIKNKNPAEFPSVKGSSAGHIPCARLYAVIPRFLARTAVTITSAATKAAWMRKALRTCAIACPLRDAESPSRCIVPALKAVASGQTVFGKDISDKIPELMTRKPEAGLSNLPLSDREKTVIACVADGLSNHEIAESLHLSEGTVRNYLSVILDKLELRDRTQLAVFYLRGGRR